MAYPKRQRSSGLTLVELLVTMSIVAILSTIAAPSFSALIATERAKSTASKLYSFLSRARSEAMMRNVPVWLVPKEGEWTKGWDVIDPRFPDTAVESSGATAGLTINGPPRVIYLNSGTVDNTLGGSFLISSPAHDSAVQCITIGAGGRIYQKASQTC